jgi:hypothetical protein
LRQRIDTLLALLPPILFPLHVGIQHTRRTLIPQFERIARPTLRYPISHPDLSLKLHPSRTEPPRYGRQSRHSRNVSS